MYVYISFAIIFSWLLKHVTSEIKCSRTKLTWIQGIEECIDGGGTPVDFDRSTGRAVESLNIRSEVTVWTSNFFSKDEYIGSCHDNCICQSGSQLCKIVHITNPFKIIADYYSDCMAERMSFCQDQSGQIRNETVNFYESQQCRYFPNNISDHRLLTYFDGFYWVSNKLEGRACFLIGKPIPALSNSSYCGSYNLKAGRFYRPCQEKQTALCDIGRRQGHNFSRSCFREQSTTYAETTNRENIVTELVRPFITTSQNSITSIDTQDLRNNSITSPVMLETAFSNGLLHPTTTKVMITSPAQSLNESSQGQISDIPNVGLIVGIVVGIIVALSVTGLVAFILARRGICLRKHPSLSSKSSITRKMARTVQAHDNITYDNTSDRQYSLAVDTELTIQCYKSTPDSVHIHRNNYQQTESQDDYNTTLQVRKFVDKQSNTYDTTTLKTQASDSLYDRTLKTKEFNASNDDYNTIISMSVPSAIHARPIDDEEEYDSISHTGHTPVVVDNIYNMLQ